MKIRTKFAVSNIIMLVTPIFSIGVISVFCMILFIFKFPVEQINIQRAQLLNPKLFVEAAGIFFHDNPKAVWYIAVWALISAAIAVITITAVTQHLYLSLRQPIDELRSAAERIENGDLSFYVLGSDYDEIDSLCRAFDDMRNAIRSSAEREKHMKEERNLLIANISHDLKTPITSIKGYISGINDGVADTPEKLERYLNTISAKADILDSMVTNLSLYSKLEMSKLSFEFVNYDMNTFLRNLFCDYELDLCNENMSLALDFCSSAPVRMDKEKMQRVFANLVNNSIKYRDGDSGSIEVKTYVENGGVYTEFSDTGIGIKEDDTKRVFDVFYRADASRSPNAGGSGLGLGIAKQIVEKHGGKIWMKTREKGIKTIIYLPLYREKTEG